MTSHSGSMPGTSTDTMLFPKQHAAIVVLCNSWSDAIVAQVTQPLAQVVVPAWKPGPPGQGFPHTDAPFAPPATLVGRWQGTMALGGDPAPMTLEVRADGTVTTTIGDGLASLVNSVQLNEGQLSGKAYVPVETADTARYKYTTHFLLTLEGDRLYGAAVAIGDLSDQRIPAGLAFWTDLKRAPAEALVK